MPFPDCTWPRLSIFSSNSSRCVSSPSPRLTPLSFFSPAPSTRSLFLQFTWVPDGNRYPASPFLVSQPLTLKLVAVPLVDSSQVDRCASPRAVPFHTFLPFPPPLRCSGRTLPLCGLLTSPNGPPRTVTSRFHPPGLLSAMNRASLSLFLLSAHPLSFFPPSCFPLARTRPLEVLSRSYEFPRCGVPLFSTLGLPISGRRTQRELISSCSPDFHVQLYFRPDSPSFLLLAVRPRFFFYLRVLENQPSPERTAQFKITLFSFLTLG